MNYEVEVRQALERWEKELQSPPGFFEKTGKTISNKINEKLPQKFHQTLTTVVKSMVHAAIFGAEYTPKRAVKLNESLWQRDETALEVISTYKKVAAAEGAGTGAGGIFLGLVDFPALIAIKLKLLFELAHVYGYSTKVYGERLFLLYVFQLAFSGPYKRMDTYYQVKHWDEHEHVPEVNWEQFQQEYRDSIDFRKMLQLLPGIGAVVGAWANYGLLEDLGKTAMNGFRLRILAESDLKLLK
ncbi:EcsC family protein [Paenibacillus eucommiae]|uniref:Uncharacterized protein (DUF697 family) n=1 Tax=Paenibacillus eucommiae TaxID=1355755 RepID=A0ABS4JAL5_9BACL|nr:EcsC family protein [Paenibacillus eucommiae]MBP1996889.1 uncharacterized protein (DUF697 family) [Paenibacillus eucommiae]